jgi:CBS domain-containing protein
MIDPVTSKRDALRSYFEERMPGHNIEALPATDVRPVGFVLRKDSFEYAIEFDADFLRDKEVGELENALDDSGVIEELCRGEGLRYVLTSRGLRLDSTN